jgi:hypothetical protein
VTYERHLVEQLVRDSWRTHGHEAFAEAIAEQRRHRRDRRRGRVRALFASVMRMPPRPRPHAARLDPRSGPLDALTRNARPRRAI